MKNALYFFNISNAKDRKRCLRASSLYTNGQLVRLNACSRFDEKMFLVFVFNCDAVQLICALFGLVQFSK